jgi:hypothetical protein
MDCNIGSMTGSELEQCAVNDFLLAIEIKDDARLRSKSIKDVHGRAHDNADLMQAFSIDTSYLSERLPFPCTTSHTSSSCSIIS